MSNGYGNAHEYISGVAWLNIETGKAGRSTAATIIDYIRQNGPFVVGGEDGWTEVHVVGSGANVYLRSVKDQTPTDNLLYLPRY
jgi:hypothetical protein